MFQRAGRACVQRQSHIDLAGGGEVAGRTQHVAGPDLIQCDAAQTHRDPAARRGGFDGPAMHLNLAQADAAA